ncbi:MAG: pilus (MSHA type) biogenesis protein MshL [Desulfoarculaceae bacterium]|nr:pilus (MSHA type) biogenesis protein MshL [Desulfoarculaceae bacterium]
MTAEPEQATAEAAKPVIQDMTPPALPVRYQTASYLVDAADRDELDSQADDVVLKVGANITSKIPVPLREIMKPLASQKKFNISWAPDVNQEVYVDVDIKADDDFYKAIDQLLRQVEYFYEIQGSTLVIKYRETKQFHIAMPFTKQDFKYATGGDLLGGKIGGEDVSDNIEGLIKLTSGQTPETQNIFDSWENIKLNLDTILNIKSTRREKESGAKDAKTTKTTTNKEGERVTSTTGEPDDNELRVRRLEIEKKAGAEIDERMSEASGSYYIDKPVGLITVTAPRHVLQKVESYITALQNEIYKQISIEAKIIEVELSDSSSIGINWTQVLSGLKIDGSVEFGTGGNIFQWNPISGATTDSRLVSDVSINPANFTLFLNALKTQGNTKVLSNPKISVLNGQPALITVGRNITYIKRITVRPGEDGAPPTYAAEPASVLSGVGLTLIATILNNNEIVMNLVPVTSEVQVDENDEIRYKTLADGNQIGVPIVNVREMSTMVRVKDGEMLVIGGLISDMNSEAGNFAPVLGDIPLVKYLFGHEKKIKNKRELIILLKPRII